MTPRYMNKLRPAPSQSRFIIAKQPVFSSTSNLDERQVKLRAKPANTGEDSAIYGYAETSLKPTDAYNEETIDIILRCYKVR